MKTMNAKLTQAVASINARIAGLEKIVIRLKEEGHTVKAKNQEYFIEGLKVALSDLEYHS